MSTQLGRTAEAIAAKALQEIGHSVLTMNWRTRRCEIDIVSTYQKRIYFTEVKFRSSDMWGTGAEYVVRAKLHQMRYAAEIWMYEHGWTGDAQLLVAHVNAAHGVEIIEL